MKKSELQQIIKEEINKVLNENQSIEINGELFKVGDEIRWLNLSLNQRRQGTINNISDEGIHVIQHTKTGKVSKLLIKPPYEQKEIFKFKND